MPFEQGPYLSAAFLCEKVLEEKDGVKSVVRIVDRLTHTAVGKMEPFGVPLSLFIRFKSGHARGASPLRINLIKPSGESLPPFQVQVYFEGEEDRGVDLVMNLTIPIEMEGMYMFEIYLQEELLTKVPLRIIYMSQIMQTYGPSGGLPPQQGPSPGT